jgi:hypothetical protein
MVIILNSETFIMSDGDKKHKEHSCRKIKVNFQIRRPKYEREAHIGLKGLILQVLTENLSFAFSGSLFV